MSKDMTNVYAEMLTKELVALRRKHITTVNALKDDYSRKSLARVKTARELIAQIEHELAERVANFGLFV
jgi:hypothetical protein